MSVERALKMLPRIFSLQPNDYSQFLPEDSVNKGIQNRWIALGKRLQNATDSIGTHCGKSSPSELKFEIVTSIVLDTLRKELENAIAERGLDAAAIDIEAILEENSTKRAIEEKVRLAMGRDGGAGALDSHDAGKTHRAYAMLVKKPSNAKKQISKRSKQSDGSKTAG